MLDVLNNLSNNAIKFGVAGYALLFLTACATGKTIDSAGDIVDNGQSNTMLVTYDLAIHVTDKYARVNRTDLVVHCGEPNRLGRVPACFRVTVPLKGRKSIEGYEYYSFSDLGAKLVQMPYGSFALKSVRHNVVVDVERYSQCNGSRYRYYSPYRHNYNRGYHNRHSHYFNHFDCLPLSVDITARYFSDVPDINTIEIGPGNGCYAGHLVLEMIDGEIIRYTLDQKAAMPSEQALSTLPTEFQQVIKERGFEQCVNQYSNS